MSGHGPKVSRRAPLPQAAAPLAPHSTEPTAAPGAAANRPSEPLETLAAAGAELLRQVPADGWCAVMLDPAACWLAQLAEDHRDEHRSAACTLSAILQQAGHAPAGTSVSARVRARSGRWVTISALRQGPPGEELTYAALTPSQPGELAALVLDAYGLTQRERDVTQQVLLGRSSTEISAALHITE